MDVIAAIGGILGLCFGFSILSIVEMVISAFEHLAPKIKETQKLKSKSKGNQMMFSEKIQPGMHKRAVSRRF